MTPSISPPLVSSPPPPAPVVSPAADPFRDLAAAEMASVLGSANHVFFGLHMSQHPGAPAKLNQVLNGLQPTRIVEIGSGNAGLTVLLALYCLNTGTALHAFDKTRFRHNDLLDRLMPGAFHQSDALEDPKTVEAIRALVAAPGRTLLLCDCGKALEFNLYIPSFKVGDVVMMHDFSPTPETFERDMRGRIWNWHEAWYARVAETCVTYGIVHSSYTNDVAWSLGWKAR